MAKGLEDTAFYVYNRLVSLNEVGGEPERFGITPIQFHRANAERQLRWPFSMLTTSTHDTKRSEDVRARISVLSERPAVWEKAVAEWSAHNARFKTDFDGALAPDPNEEWLLYQTLIGSLPFRMSTPAEIADYTERVVAYMRKATKEAKVNTSWMNADPEYDAAIETFVRRLLDPANGFLDRIAPLAREVSWHGMWGSLSQTLLRCTAPGVPDLYQGNEIWDFSLVDPDNRRPVDYTLRGKLLDDVLANKARGAAYLRELVATPEDGRVKMFVIHAALAARARWPEVFGAHAAYVPLTARGPHADHVIAYARRHAKEEIVTVVSRFTAKLLDGAIAPPIGACWADDALLVAPGRFLDLSSGRSIDVGDDDEGSALSLSEVFADCPVALLRRIE
jgi:(1->4)-alpha-D-glucan 1-alpha-D-glucosylmutase